MDQYNSLTFALDLNKLMVPSPPIYEVDINGNYIIDPLTNQPTIQTVSYTHLTLPTSG